MTAFSDLAPMTGRGMMWLLDVSFDGFATVAYRWATHAGDVGGQHYEKRLAASGDITHGFGTDHLPAAATLSMVIDNTDFAADWLSNRTTVASQVFRARFKLMCGLTDDTVNTYQANVLTKTVGIFVCMDYPVRQAAAILIDLADDSLGQLADVLTPPTFMDWYNDAGTNTTNAPFDTNLGNLKAVIDLNLPLPLQFGDGEAYSTFQASVPCYFPLQRSPLSFDVASGFHANDRNATYPIVVLATRNLAALANDVVILRGVYRKDVINDATGLAGRSLDLPSTYIHGAAGSSDVRHLWTAYKTQTITKDGYAWQILWIALDVATYYGFMTDYVWSQNPNGTINPGNPWGSTPIHPDYAWINNIGGSAAPVAPGTYNPAYEAWIAAFDHFEVVGTPGSGVNDGATALSGNGVLIMRDLVEWYSPMGTPGVDTARFARALLARGPARMRGNIIATGAGAAVTGDVKLNTAKPTPYGIGTLRATIAQLAASADLDVFLTSTGQVAVVSQGADFQSSTDAYPVYFEERIDKVQDATPSAGARWTPYNRVFVATAASAQMGPYDNLQAISDWDRIIAKVVDATWWSGVEKNLNSDPTNSIVWQIRNLESKVRPVISFEGDLSWLALELGDYFLLPWTRGGQNSAYPSTLWRLESIVISPSKGTCTVAAVWMEDLRTDYPYLLDNETLVVRSLPGFADTLTCTTGSTTVVRSGGSFITDGLAAHDHILLRDTSEALGGFTRNRQIAVVSITDALHAVVADSVFGAAGAHVLAATDWTMMKSERTYPDVISDAANYPSGSLMYGKVSAIVTSLGVYSDSSAANKLLDG